jgi:hypothetical protein
MFFIVISFYLSVVSPFHADLFKIKVNYFFYFLYFHGNSLFILLRTTNIQHENSKSDRSLISLGFLNNKYSLFKAENEICCLRKLGN